MVTVPHKTVGLERLSDHRGVPVFSHAPLPFSDRLLDFQDECGDTYYAENEPLAYAYLLRRLYLRYTHEVHWVWFSVRTLLGVEW